MFEFAKELAVALPDFKLVLQESVDPWLDYDYDLSNLKSLSNVEILPSYIDRHKLDEIVKSASFTILPYDVNIYWIRGSAAMFESIENRKPVIALRGFSLSSDISDFYLGQIAKDAKDMVNCIKSLTSSRNVNLGFEAFANYSENQIRSWVK
jgi:hypothetical protein